jgi:hypothetical protein
MLIKFLQIEIILQQHYRVTSDGSSISVFSKIMSSNIISLQNQIYNETLNHNCQFQDMYLLY